MNTIENISDEEIQSIQDINDQFMHDTLFDSILLYEQTRETICDCSRNYGGKCLNSIAYRGNGCKGG